MLADVQRSQGARTETERDVSPRADSERTSRFIDREGEAPDEFTTEFFFWTIPALEGWPKEAHGQDVVVPCGVYNGPVVFRRGDEICR